MNAPRRSLAIAAAFAAIVSGCSSSGKHAANESIASVPIGSTSTTAAGSAPTGPTAPDGSATTAAPGTSGTAPPGSAAPTTPASTPATSVGPTSPTPPDPASLAFVPIGQVESAVDLAYRAGDPALYIVSKTGYIVRIVNDAVDPTHVLDVSSGVSSGSEQGLLGMTFSVDGTHAYTDLTNTQGDTEITEWAVGADGTFDPASKRLLLTIDQPYANHNGGQVRIGPDGYLYIGMGDGGAAGDPQRRALNVNQLLGKILRIDPTPAGDSPYTIPPDNPFIGTPNAHPEIWSVGMRNPWRYSWDRATNDLWIADVGQDRWEEIDAAWADTGAGKGANFGWSAFEGTHPFNDDQPTDGVTPPIWEYPHGDLGCSISGGVRYRGTAIPALYGWYVYSDYCAAGVRALRINDDRTAGPEVQLNTDIASVSEVAQGPDGELYVLSVDNGQVFAVRPAG